MSSFIPSFAPSVAGKFYVTIGSDEAGFVELDCSETESHQRTAEVTEHPVEDGADISDHVKIIPGRLTITGIVSDMQPVLIGRRDRTPNRGNRAHELIKSFMHDRRVITVTTALQQWENMVVTGLTIPCNAGTGDSVQMTIDFQEVRFAKTSTLESSPEPKKETPKPTRDLGKKPTQEATPAQSTKSQSTLASWAS